MSKIKQDKIPVNILKAVKITKLTDDFFKQIGKDHPNMINEGFTKTGFEVEPPTIGERYYVDNFSTSPVLAILDGDTIKTTYSTYKIEYINE